MRNLSRFITWSCRAVTALLAAAVLLAGAAPAIADPFDVTNDADYQRLLDAGTAAQIMRFEQSVAPNPRLAASAAAIGVFAARNPLATQEQLGDFVTAYDALLGAAYADDPDLTHGSHLLSAVAFKSRVIGAPSLVGLETNIGADVLERLGLGVTASSRSTRTVEFERAGQWDFANSAALGRILVESLMGVDAAGEPHPGAAFVTAEYLRAEGIEPFPSATDLMTDGGDLCLDDRVAGPRGAGVAGLVEEAFEHFLSAGRVSHLRMELDAVETAAAVLHRRHRCTGARSRGHESLRCPSHRVAVTHPHFLTLGKVLEQNRARGCDEFGLAVFGLTGVGDVAVESGSHELMAIANPEHGYPEAENRRIDAIGVFGIDRSRSARENDSGRFQRRDRVCAHVARDDRRVDVRLPDPAGDQLGVLGAEVDDENGLFGARRHRQPIPTC